MKLHFKSPSWGEGDLVTIWKSLTWKGKLRYVWDYGKLPLAILAIVLYMIGYSAFRRATVPDPVFYAGFVNVTVSDGLYDRLTNGYLEATGLLGDRQEVIVYRDWYLTDDTQSDSFAFSIASRMKIIAALDAQLLDLIICDRESLDAFSQNGYLCDLTQFLSQAAEVPETRKMALSLREILTPDLARSLVILEDNAADVVLDPTIAYESVTEEIVSAVEITDSPLMAEAGFNGSVYLAVTANTPRPEQVISYLDYLFRQE